jgi:hypothetical protein
MNTPPTAPVKDSVQAVEMTRVGAKWSSDNFLPEPLAQAWLEEYSQQLGPVVNSEWTMLR